MEKLRVRMMERMRSGNSYSHIEAADLEELQDLLEDKGITAIDIKCNPPYDDTPDTIKADLAVADLTEKDFDHLAKSKEFKPFITKANVIKPREIKPEDVRVLIFRGTKEIGGSCIELRTQNSRIILDIGMPLIDEQGNEFDQRTISGASTEHLIREGILPKVRGLYHYSCPRVDAVLISHGHLDHYGFLSHVHRDIPVYMSHGTSELIKITKYFGRFDGSTNSIKPVDECQPFTIGEFTVTPYPVDHSAPGAVAWKIEACEKTILYTGDFTLHGGSNGTISGLEALKGTNIDYLLMEGTSIGSDQNGFQTEAGLKAQMIRIFESDDSLQLIGCSSQNLSRLYTIYQACVCSDRVFVVDPYTAYTIDRMRYYANIPRFEWGNHIRVFFAPDQHTDKLIEDKIAFRYQPFKITKKEILSSTSKILLKDSRTIRSFLRSKKRLNGMELIWSLWEGYLKDQLDSINADGMHVTTAHVSGHAYVNELCRSVRELKPANLIPIHTCHPEVYQDLFGVPTIKMSDNTMRVI